VADYQNGGFRLYHYAFSEGIGTHIDAPCHHIADGRSIAELSLSELIVPACVIDVRRQVSVDPDYAISIADIGAWELKYGPIPAGSLVLGLTSWDQYWQQESRYCNQDADGVMHFPGFSEEAAGYLLAREIAGLGIDTFSLDPGISQDYPVHGLMLGANKYQIENLTGLAQLPATGAWVLALPLKVSNGPEAPARVIAWLPE
jgi:kynurenine formamidase